MATWIWKFGEFETYHNLLVHQRRQMYGYPESPMWKLYPTDPNVTFTYTFETEGGPVHIEAQGRITTEVMPGSTEGKSIHEISMGSVHYWGKHDFSLEPGRYTMTVRAICPESFPAIYVNGAVESGPDWMADDLTLNPRPVGTWNRMNDPSIKPSVFPFAYEPIAVAEKTVLEKGLLFDFGKESFGPVCVSTGTPCALDIYYGESKEEALSKEWTVVQFHKDPVGSLNPGDTPDTLNTSNTSNGKICLPASAFRYIYIEPKAAEWDSDGLQIEACQEYLPEEREAVFHCSDPLLEKVWNTAAYTFHLNSREFLLDGVKRDRWAWCADAYQSFFVNRYLFADEALEQRTLISLGGKRPFERHINTIVDYTFFWVMALREHYQTYGNLTFVRQIRPQLEEIMGFLLGRADEDGYFRGRDGDWIFIDWADLDKTGAVMGEQVLWAKTLEDYAFLLEALGEEASGIKKQAEELQEHIRKDFWRADKGAFVDSFESGRDLVTRQSNYLAYLFLPMPDEWRDKIVSQVVKNPQVAPVTTPYFKFYEYQVLAEAGDLKALLEDIHSYYGGMIALGATSLYEQYDPADEGTAHYAMYGRPFEKSLAHAWSASPIYIIGRYLLGLRGTDIGYKTYEVKPDLSGLDWMKAELPLPGHKACVSIKVEKADEGIFCHVNCT
ncbi:MAG: hypothetical protein J6P72_09885 [Firmicutes bacterium]|nr:hypothetical protein [Bacillota bacterium]